MGKSINYHIVNTPYTDLKIDYVSFFRKELTSIEGVEKYEHMHILSVSSNFIESLKELKNIKHPEWVTKLICDNNKIESLEGIEHLTNLKFLKCNGNIIKSLEPLKTLTKLTEIQCYNNDLESLKGIENLSGLDTLMIAGNPCEIKYRGLTAQEIVERVKLESCLEVGNDRRGEASILDTGLFDFKIK